MSDSLATEIRSSRLRPLARSVARIAAMGSGIAIVAGLAGQAIRDRSVATALMMYIPLVPMGIVVLALDLYARGRTLPRFRFSLTILGLVAIGWSTISMVGHGAVSQSPASGEVLTLLHWNVMWGGGRIGGPMAWETQRAAIVDRHPDLIVLSEAPADERLGQLATDLGAGTSYVGIFHDPRRPYWYRMVVCSRWPVRLEGRVPVPGGVAMSVTAEVRGRDYRLLVVDGVSSPSRSRLPFLGAIADACRESASSGRPYDCVVGDFNTPSRSLGFDELADQGYQLAGRSSSGWRATFPAWLPVYDIDHVWVGPRLRILSCTLFNGPWTDHRGQIVGVHP
ncbi:MAG: endonuclease/exonuclease/phosphatase family protein [Isosphaeraceae bacterium]